MSYVITLEIGEFMHPYVMRICHAHVRMHSVVQPGDHQLYLTLGLLAKTRESWHVIP